MNKKYIRLLIITLFSFGHITSVSGDTRDSDKNSLQFIVLGDWGTPHSAGQKLVAAQMNSLAADTPIDFIATTGDNFYMRGVQSVNDPLWRHTFENIYSLPALKEIPWFVTLGNHDYMGNINAQIDYGDSHKIWNLPRNYYSTDFKVNEDTHLRILFLDTNPFLEEYTSRPDIYHHIDKQDSAHQVNWMNKTLDESKTVWRIAVGHHPVYSAGYHGDTQELKNVLPRLFERQKVQAYFAGHDHHLEHYQLVGMTHYFISGGGSKSRAVPKRQHSEFAAPSLGFAHVTLDSTCMLVRFVNENGEELYQTRQSFDNGTQCQ